MLPRCLLLDSLTAMDLVDPFGRTIRDLRISVTDRCNFRCTYCMPEEGMMWVPRSEVLTFEEIERLARIFVERFEVDGLRLTGGEPTVRAHLPVLVGKLAALRVPSSSRVATCRPGTRPVDRPPTAPRSGWSRTTCARPGSTGSTSASTRCTRDRSWQMTRRDELDSVLDGIEAAKEAGFAPVKINAVVERGVNDDEIVDLARFGREHDVEVRFIEFMPLDATGALGQRRRSSSQDEIVAAIDAVFPLEQVPSAGAAPADRWRYLDGRGTVGVIPTVTKPFCGDCDRVRLTADGQFRTCLFATDEFDLRELMRGGADDDASPRRSSGRSARSGPATRSTR